MVTGISLQRLGDIFIRNDVNYMSKHVFGLPYSSLKSVLYPHPRYKTFTIKKRNGNLRIIHEPKAALKKLQLKALAFLESRCDVAKPCVHGFVSGRSIVTNAAAHIAKAPAHLLNLDIEDFFPSISFYRVRGVLQKKPFNFSHSVATVIAQLCTYNNALPQGAPTSPFLSNLVCRSLDRDLMALAKRHRATYTRYADDLTFSFSTRESHRLPANIASFDSGEVRLGHELQAIIETQHTFRIHQAKSRMSTRFHRMEITGLTVNEFPNVKRVYIDKIRGALNAWKKYGYVSANDQWDKLVAAGWSLDYKKRPWKRQTRTGNTPQLKNILWGKLLYLRMVRGKNDAIYTRLAETYNSLCNAQRIVDTNFQSSSLPVEKIVRNNLDAEAAVFVIEWSGDFQSNPEGPTEMVLGQGTAFAYKSNLQLITCEHVLRWVGQINGNPIDVHCTSEQIQNLTLSIFSPRLNQRWSARVVHSDRDRDLALLEFTDGGSSQRHFTAADSPITPNQRGHLIGFPNWTPGRNANYVNTTVLNRFPRTGLQRIEISDLIRQGNSGGPFVDELYRVAGVAQQGARQDQGNDECLCISELDRWLTGLEPTHT